MFGAAEYWVRMAQGVGHMNSSQEHRIFMAALSHIDDDRGVSI